MLLFFGLFVAIFMRVSAWENDAQMLEFRLVSQQVLDRIRTRLDEQEVFLHQLERSFSRRDADHPSRFRRIWSHACCSVFRCCRRSNGHRGST